MRIMDMARFRFRLRLRSRFTSRFRSRFRLRLSIMDMATCPHRFVGTWAAIALAVYSLALVVVANRERLVASMGAHADSIGS